MPSHEVYDITMNVGATIKQSVEIIDKDLTINDLIEGLIDERFETTLSHDGVSTIHGSITDANGRLIAKVHCQREIVSVFSDFALDGDVVGDELAEMFMHEDQIE